MNMERESLVLYMTVQMNMALEIQIVYETRPFAHGTENYEYARCGELSLEFRGPYRVGNFIIRNYMFKSIK